MGLTCCLPPPPLPELACSPHLLQVLHWELSKFEERTSVAELGVSSGSCLGFPAATATGGHRHDCWVGCPQGEHSSDRVLHHQRCQSPASQPLVAMVYPTPTTQQGTKSFSSLSLGPSLSFPSHSCLFRCPYLEPLVLVPPAPPPRSDHCVLSCPGLRACPGHAQHVTGSLATNPVPSVIGCP